MQANKINYIFLDEVQNIPQFEKLVDGLYASENTDIYITGSNAFLLSSELATLLTGRYIAINLQPYSFKEYTSAYSEETNTDKLFRKFINESCFPEAVTLSKNDENLVIDYLQSIYDTVIIKDISQRHGLRNEVNLHRIVSFLFDSIGKYVSPTKVPSKNTFAVPSIKLYCSQPVSCAVKNAFASNFGLLKYLYETGI